MGHSRGVGINRIVHNVCKRRIPYHNNYDERVDFSFLYVFIMYAIASASLYLTPVPSVLITVTYLCGCGLMVYDLCFVLIYYPATTIRLILRKASIFARTCSGVKPANLALIL